MGGYQQLVRGEPMRGKFRNSYEKPEPFTPGEVTAVELDHARHLSHISPRPSHHGAGAKHVVSARGPQSTEVLQYLPLPRAADFQKATQRIYRSPEAASQVRVMVLDPAGQ